MSTPFNVKKPASVTSIKEESPEVLSASDNFSAERLVGMTFNMPYSWHRKFKMAAVQEGISMRDLLIKAFDGYLRDNQSKKR